VTQKQHDRCASCLVECNLLVYIKAPSRQPARFATLIKSHRNTKDVLSLAVYLHACTSRECRNHQKISKKAIKNMCWRLVVGDFTARAACVCISRHSPPPPTERVSFVYRVSTKKRRKQTQLRCLFWAARAVFALRQNNWQMNCGAGLKIAKIIKAITHGVYRTGTQRKHTARATSSSSARRISGL
jgi:hypothetical protein